MSNLTAGIRRAATPVRATGRPVPSTAGVNDGDPILQSPTPARTVGAVAPAFPKSSDGAHKSNGWHELTDVEHRAYTETLASFVLTDGQSVTLDPIRVQVYRIEVSGATTITVPKPSFPVPANARQDDPARHRTWSCVLMVFVPIGGTVPTITGAKWAEGQTTPNIKTPTGDDPDDYGGTYVFTFVHDPIANQVYGFESGARF